MSDLGIVVLYDYLQDIGITAKLENNYIEIKPNEEAIEGLLEKIKNEISSYSNEAVIPYLRNSPRFGYNGPKDERMYENLRDVIRLTFFQADNNISSQVLEKYEPIGKCIICNTYLATNKHYKEGQLTERKVSRVLYPFLGAENSEFNNYCKFQGNICFVCEFLSIIFLLHVKKFELNMLAYCEKLRDLKYINHIIAIQQKLYSKDALYLRLAKLNSNSIKLFNIRRDPKEGVMLRYANSFDVSSLIQKLMLIDIVKQFNFSTNKKETEHLEKLIFNDNYIFVKQVLLSNLLTKDNSKDNRKQIQNIRLYNDFLEEGGFEVKGADEFFAIGKRIAEKISEENKRKSMSFRLIHLLKSNNREQLFNELTHMLINYELPMPRHMSNAILKSNDIQLHYNIGKFLEGFNEREEIV